MDNIVEPESGGPSSRTRRGREGVDGVFGPRTKSGGMVGDILAPGASVSNVAQRYGVNPNQLFTWRRKEARSAATGALATLG